MWLNKVHHVGQCWQRGEFDHFMKICPLLKRQGILLGTECLNSPRILKKHPQVSSQKQTIHWKSCIDGTTVTRSNRQENTLNPDPSMRISGRQYFYRWKTSDSSFEYWESCYSFNHDCCQKHGIQIYLNNQMVSIEEIRGNTTDYHGHVYISQIVTSYWK